MKTIKEYKQEFLKLANELEKDYSCPINSIYISRRLADDNEPIDSCDIEF